MGIINKKIDKKHKKVLHFYGTEYILKVCQKYGTKKGGEIMDRYTPEQARKLKGLSQKNMAIKMGLSENTYINKEKGNTKFFIDEACKFCDIIDMPLEKIIFFE